MPKIKVECSDPHSPQGVFEFHKEDAERLVKLSPHYKFVEGGTVSQDGKIFKQTVKFSEKQTEKEIEKLIKKHKIEIEYDISNEAKKDKLKELEKLGFDVEWEED